MSITDDATAEPLNKKDITEEIMGVSFEFKDDGESEEQQEQQKPDELNPLVDVVDCGGLDFAEEFLQDAGYPPLKRKIWEDHGKKALSKAINAYCLSGSPLGGTMDTPLVALLIGIGSLLLCFWPVLQKVMQDREKPAEIPAPKEQPQESESEYEHPVPASPSATRPRSVNR